MGKITEFLGKLAGLTGGLLLIALIIMWFGAVPLVAFIFGSISGWGLIGMTTLMIALIILVGHFVTK